MPDESASPTIRCLVLACGNTLRSDDGVGPWLAERMEERFASQLGVQVIIRQQWTPELAEPLAQADSTLFIDCSIAEAPGSVGVLKLAPSARKAGLATHHLGAEELLALAGELYGAAPNRACLLTVGAGSIELGEEFSEAMRGSLDNACSVAYQTVLELLALNAGK